MKKPWMIWLAMTAVVLAALSIYLHTQVKSSAIPPITTAEKNVAPEIISNGQWLKSQPIKLADLKGKVVLLHFWTQTSITSQRALPYFQTWSTKYKNDGLVVIGVHSPEFTFEKDVAGVQRVMDKLQLTYPIVQDNELATWKAYDNKFRPVIYLVDAEGNIRYTHAGEGQYDQTEQQIQTLLKEAGKLTDQPKVENPQYDIYLRTPELYLGHQHMVSFTSPQGIQRDRTATYTSRTPVPDDTFSYEGNWIIMPEYSVPSKDAKLRVKFEAKEVYIIARPKKDNAVMKVTLDGIPQALGEDNKEGTVTVDSGRLYKLIRLNALGRHELMIHFDDDAIELYAIRFG